MEGFEIKYRDISIHALLAESDRPGQLLLLLLFHFYPRSPCGERLVTKVQWDNILTKSQSDGCTCKEIIAEAVPWAAKCFETNDVFTIIGM